MSFQELFSRSKPVRYRAGDTILRQDDTTAWVLYVESGLVREFVLSEEGIEVTLAYHTPGAVFPYVFFTGDTLLPSGFESHGETALRRVGEQEFNEYFTQEPDALPAFTRDMAARQRSVIKRIGCLVFCHAYTRVIDSILYLAAHFGKRTDGMVQITERFTHRDIAALAGVRRETASTEISALVRKGLIAYEGKDISIPDISRLHGELDAHKEKK